MSDAIVPRPAGYPAIVPYLLPAAAAPLIAFLEAAFGAVTRFTVPSETGGVMHGELDLAGSVLMISDAGHAETTQLCHYVPDCDATYAAALAAGAASVAPPETKPYGHRVAGITDPAGNTWWICTLL